jgi:hypothetical protein
MSLYRGALIVAVTGVFSAAGADTIYVDDDNCPGLGDGTELNPYCSIQIAIDHAVDGDEIVVAPGTYFETINYLGRAIALRSSDGPEVTTIDGGGAGPVVQCVAGEGPGTVLEGFTITGGAATAGAGMSNAASSPTVVGCVFADNHAVDSGAGGAMFNTAASSVTLVDTTFVGNTAEVGAGIFSEVLSNLSVSGCTFRENRAIVGGAINIRDFAQITVTDTRFVDNGEFGAVGGGAIAAFDCDLAVSGCEFIGNEAAGGAGIVAGIGTLTVRDSVFVGNKAAYAGGSIYELNLAASFVNCLFSNNEGGFGGGVFIASEDVTLVNCTFADNSGSGVTEEVPAIPVLQNCVFWNNEPAQLDTEPPGAPSFASLFYCNVQGGFAGPGSNNIDADPLFVGGPAGTWTDAAVYDPATGETTYSDVNASFVSDDLVGKFLVSPLLPGIERPIVANSATTITVFGDSSFWGVPGIEYGVNDYRLSAGSPCIDAGNNAAVPEDTTNDLDGLPRFLELPETPDTGNGTAPIVDMGPYESRGDGCLAITSLETLCHGNGTSFTVNAEGLDACTGGTTMVTFTGAGGAVGEDFCATLVVSTQGGGYCCSTELCVPVPDCANAVLLCDLDGDGAVGVLDFLALLDAWGSCSDCGSCAADFDGDCEVGVSDVLILLALWSP